MGGSFKWEEAQVCLWCIHGHIWQKPTQYHKTIILQLKINIFKIFNKNKWFICNEIHFVVNIIVRLLENAPIISHRSNYSRKRKSFYKNPLFWVISSICQPVVTLNLPTHFCRIFLSSFSLSFYFVISKLEKLKNKTSSSYIYIPLPTYQQFSVYKNSFFLINWPFSFKLIYSF